MKNKNGSSISEISVLPPAPPLAPEAILRPQQSSSAEMWATLSTGERRLITALIRMLRAAKNSQIHDVARAAAKWESGITCFIKVRLINQKTHAARHQKLLQNPAWLRLPPAVHP
jgi:hypothetical protein